ncbi:hypothetical protein BN1723_006800 [Verticillium longisporum]|uniref:Ketoreductase domain-containing protein n=1 Tax=Verticillium longisporum TaxID=100787 RepID=A0A0G4NHP2_VERLO|nr:hypothetical protein BN1723_006800 [Verticillium longisporum]
MPSKVFIVTGASRGLGLAIAKYLLEASHRVVLAARSKDKLEELKTAYPTQSVPQVAHHASKTFGRIDGIVINHGVLTPLSRLENGSIEEWRKSYDINVFSGLAIVQAALPELRKSKGSVLWVSSGAATKAYTAWGAYGSSKAAMDHISAHLAVEEPDITTVAVTPGRVDTDMQKLIREGGKDAMNAKDHSAFSSAYDSGELVKPEQPGHVMARFVIDPDHSLTGKLEERESPLGDIDELLDADDEEQQQEQQQQQQQQDETPGSRADDESDGEIVERSQNGDRMDVDRSPSPSRSRSRERTP